MEGNNNSLTENIKKLGSDAFEKAVNYLKTSFPSYDPTSNLIRIPEKNIRAFVQYKCSEIPEIKKIDLECCDGYINLNIIGTKAHLPKTLDLKCFIERFEIGKSSQIAEIRFESGNKINGNRLIMKMALAIAQGLITSLLEKRIQDFSGTFHADDLIQLNWPRAKIFLSNFPLIQSLKQKTIMGVNLFDFISIERADIIKGYVTVVPHIFVKPNG